jgi:hypothetical protein
VTDLVHDLIEGRQDPEIARGAPYTTPVRRLDEAGAAKRPVGRQPRANSDPPGDADNPEPVTRGAV